MKPITEGKSRLAPSLEDGRRRLLSLGMLARVLVAAVGAPGIEDVVVYGGDSAVRRASTKLGAGWRQDPGAGLNGCLRAAFSEAAGQGPGFGLFLPADLPLVTSGDLEGFLASVDGFPLALAPDLADDGTNALLVDLTTPFTTQLGEASFNRHIEQANKLGIDHVVHRSERLGLDIDTAADLEQLLRVEPGLWRGLDAELREAGLEMSMPVSEATE